MVESFKPSLQRRLLAITARKDLVLAFFLIGIVFLMILPIPTSIVDLLIASNIAMSLILLTVAIYIKSPLEFSAFPAVLLLTTLFRLALSITTTRLILLQADAGDIVTAFGNFVVGGNWAVGIVVFLIITVVQFLVITKGSERVAEVGARFSLDAMPGKQMSIDGDVRAGVLDNDRASSRRADVEKESQLYGSMDGAMKFVKGDAIAGLVIIVVNIVGGISIGVAQGGLSFGAAVELYTILTIGDGLVAQIPALLISITAGFIVTRVAQEETQDLGREISDQIFRNPNVMKLGAAIMVIFGLIPGFPTVTFWGIAIVLAIAGFWDGSEKDGATTASASKDDKALEAVVAKRKTDANLDNASFELTVPLMIDIADNTDGFIDRNSLNDNLFTLRRKLYLDLGVPFPGLNLRFNESLPPNQYNILLHEIPIGGGALSEDKLLVIGQTESLESFNLPIAPVTQFSSTQTAHWIGKDHKAELENLNIAYLSYHLSLVLTRHAEDFLGIQETHSLLENMEPKYSELLAETQRIAPLQKINEILKRLVSEGVSIRNLRLILEAIVEWGPKEKDLVTLVEYIRSNLKRQISHRYGNGRNAINVYLLDADLEDTIRSAIRQTSSGSYLAMDPETTANFIKAVRDRMADALEVNQKPVVLASMDIRRFVRKIIEPEFQDLAVLSHQDVTADTTVHPVGRIAI